MSSQHDRRLAALEAQHWQRQVEQAHDAGAGERILARLATIRARMEAAGTLVEGSEAEMAQHVAELKTRLQTRLQELGRN